MRPLLSIEITRVAGAGHSDTFDGGTTEGS